MDTNTMSSVWVVVRQQNDDNMVILEGIYSTEEKAHAKVTQLMDIMNEYGEWKNSRTNYWENNNDEIYIEKRYLDRYDEVRDY